METLAEICVVGIGLVVMIATIVFGVANFFIPIFTAFIEAPGFAILFLSLIKLTVSTFIGTLIVVLEFMFFLWIYAMVDMA